MTVFILLFPSIVKVVSPCIYKSARKSTAKQRKKIIVRTSNVEVGLFCFVLFFFKARPLREYEVIITSYSLIEIKAKCFYFTFP